MTDIATLIAKEDIRELVLLYSRGVDRKDGPLLRTLYAEGATDTHGDSFDGDAEGYVDFLERSFPYMAYSGHHVCNHLISVDGDKGNGEVYALAIHVIPDDQGGWIEDTMAVRYIDNYIRQAGQWRFANRVVTYDMRTRRPYETKVSTATDPSSDPSHAALSSRLFQRGPRA